ncbi:MAG: hypothetical protein Q9M17_10025 [Mariprofundus sp.]|nr:hypothetical protein [Mariprofundus sp.]
MSGLKDALSKISAGIKDLSSLEVQTYTGSIEIKEWKPTGEAADAKLNDFEGYLKDIKQSEANLKLVAVTKMNFDGDSINLTSETAPLNHVQTLHDGAVKAGVETRQGLVALFKELVS